MQPALVVCTQVFNLYYSQLVFLTKSEYAGGKSVDGSTDVEDSDWFLNSSIGIKFIGCMQMGPGIVITPPTVGIMEMDVTSVPISFKSRSDLTL